MSFGEFASEFATMGGYGFYVWGSYAACALAIAAEIIAVTGDAFPDREHEVMASLHRRGVCGYCNGLHLGRIRSAHAGGRYRVHHGNKCHDDHHEATDYVADPLQQTLHLQPPIGSRDVPVREAQATKAGDSGLARFMRSADSQTAIHPSDQL